MSVPRHLPVRWLCAVALAAFLIPAVSAPAQDKPKDELKKQVIPFPLPDFPDIEKLLPQGLDPDQIKEIKKQLEQAREEARKALADLQKQFPDGVPGIQLRPGTNPFAAGNRLGAAVTRPADVLIEQLDLPRDQGLVLNNIKADSAAAKAGLKNNDILLEFGGKKVPNQPGDFIKTLNEYKTGDKVDAVVLRKGKKETVKDVTLPDVPRNANPLVNPKLDLKLKIPKLKLKIGPDGKIEIDGLPNNLPGVPKIQILPDGTIPQVPNIPELKRPRN